MFCADEKVILVAGAIETTEWLRELEEPLSNENVDRFRLLW